MLVVVVRPGLGELAIPNMEQQHRWTASSAPISFGVRAVQPDGMVVVGHHVMEGGPEGPTRPLIIRAPSLEAAMPCDGTSVPLTGD
jgi:hypothetical protein